MVISQSTDATQAEKRKEGRSQIGGRGESTTGALTFFYTVRERGVEQQPKIAEV